MAGATERIADCAAPPYTEMIDYIYEKRAGQRIYTSGVWIDFKMDQRYSAAAARFSAIQLKIIFHNTILRELERFCPRTPATIDKIAYFNYRYYAHLEETLLTNEDFVCRSSIVQIQVVNHQEYRREQQKTEMIANKDKIDRLDYTMSFFVCTNDERIAGTMLSKNDIKRRMWNLQQKYRSTGEYTPPFDNAIITLNEYIRRVQRKPSDSNRESSTASISTSSQPSVSSSTSSLQNLPSQNMKTIFGLSIVHENDELQPIASAEKQGK